MNAAIETLMERKDMDYGLAMDEYMDIRKMVIQAMREKDSLGDKASLKAGLLALRECGLPGCLIWDFI